MNVVLRMQFAEVQASAVRDVLREWPGAPRRLANQLIRSYGMPNEATQTMLLWHYNGSWKRTAVHRNGAAHHVPHHHVDLLEQTVEVKVPIPKQDEIAAFDGSIIIDRTRGEMTAFCENESTNILILNLAYDIAIGKKNAREARDFMQKFEGPIQAQWPNPYRERLQFTSTILPNNPDMTTAEPD